MQIIETKTLEDLQNLYDHSAMTWEGLNEDSFEEALDYCCAKGKDGTGYKTTGKVMNELCNLTGDNAYPDDLTIFSIPNFKGLAIQFGARWMDDIIDNNAYRQNFHPFGSSHYGG